MTKWYNPYPLRGPNDHNNFHSNTADIVNVLKYFEQVFFYFCIQTKCWFSKFRSEIHKMLARIGNRKDLDHTASSEAV